MPPLCGRVGVLWDPHGPNGEDEVPTVHKTILLLTAVGLLLACAPSALAEDAAAVRDAIDAALASPTDSMLARRADSSPWNAHAIGGADACAPCAPRADPCAPPDPCASPWTFEVGLALSLAQGNSDKFDLALAGKAEYSRDPTLFRVEGLFAYGESDGATTTEAYHVTLRGERKLGNRWYAFAQLDYDRDRPAELEYRWTGLGGLGVYLVDNALVKWKAEAGGGYVWEKRLNLPSSDDPSAYFGTEFNKKWRTGAEFTASYQFVPNLGDFDLTLMVFKAALSVPICDQLSLTVSLRVDHVIEPPPPAENTDLLLAVGLKLNL